MKVLLGLLAFSPWFWTTPGLTQEAAPYWKQYEARIGVMAHGLWGPEAYSTTINGEFIFPRTEFLTIAPEWRWMIPRIHIGGMLNTAGKTNYAYVGALWTYDLTQRFFVEAALGGAVHDGSLLGAPGRSGLGCRFAYHLAASIGYRFAPNWSVMATLDHISNGTGTFSNCERNQAINELGVRVGYSF
jgi:hypothetical protein